MNKNSDKIGVSLKIVWRLEVTMQTLSAKERSRCVQRQQGMLGRRVLNSEWQVRLVVMLHFKRWWHRYLTLTVLMMSLVTSLFSYSSHGSLFLTNCFTHNDNALSQQTQNCTTWTLRRNVAKSPHIRNGKKAKSWFFKMKSAFQQT